MVVKPRVEVMESGHSVFPENKATGNYNPVRTTPIFHRKICFSFNACTRKKTILCQLRSNLEIILIQKFHLTISLSIAGL